jgi:hypothetical protein
MNDNKQLYVIEFGSGSPEDRCTHFEIADSAEAAIEQTRKVMWGAIERDDAIRVAGPYPAPRWSEWRRVFA